MRNDKNTKNDMADDQVKYSDLIADDVAAGFELLNKVMKELQSTMASLKNEATGLGAVIKGTGSANREQQQEIARLSAELDKLRKQMKGVSDEEKKVAEIKRQYKKLTDDQIARVDKLASALNGLKTADEAQRKHALARINLINVENMSYNELQATYNALKDSLNAMTVAERQNTEAGKAMTAQSAKIYDTMNELQKATGKYTLQVGKYRAAFDGLGYSFQQILREAPSALNLNQFFLAISNNVPMFLDQLKAFKAEQADIKANLAQMTKGTKEYEEQLGKVESVGKKLGRTLLSWQSLVLVGLMALRKLPDILSSISGWFRNVSTEVKLLREVNEGAASSIGSMRAKYEALRKEYANLKEEDKDEWVKNHSHDWDELGESIDSVEKAEDIYVRNTDNFLDAIDRRAKSIAAMNVAAKKYEEAFNKRSEAEKAVVDGDATWYNKLKQGVMAFGMTGGGSRAQLLPWQKKELSETIKKDAENYAKELRDEADRLEKEASMLITEWVLPEGNGNGTDKPRSTKEPKDQVADLLTLKRAWEDAQIANIEDEYVREEAAEMKRHERFIEDKKAELKLVENDAERKAIIQKQIEEETNTHDRLMLEIDEKYRQIIIKRIEDQKKKEEQVQKEAERQAKEKIQREEKDFKAHQEIDKRRFELTKHTATEEKKFVMEQQMEFLQWRIDHAEALGISPELLEVMKAEYEQMKKMYDLGKYSNGKQNIQGNYTSISQILWPDLDSDQTSALNSVFDQAKEALNGWMQAKVDAANQSKELADDEVAAAENALNREIELRNQGYANDVALKERELADAKKRQQEAAKLQQKAKKDQLAVNTAMEASSMAVAVANLFKDFPLYAAIPLTAVLLGAFAAAKVQSFQAINSTKYREGGVMLLEGGSHQSGHDVNLGIGPDGSNLRAEGGEYFAVINKRNSRRYGSEIPNIVNALNSGMFEDRYIKTSDAMGMLPRIIKSDDGSTVDLSAVESGVGALVKQGERTWSMEGEYRVMRYKNLTRRVRLS